MPFEGKVFNTPQIDRSWKPVISALAGFAVFALLTISVIGIAYIRYGWNQEPRQKGRPSTGIIETLAELEPHDIFVTTVGNNTENMVANVVIGKYRPPGSVTGWGLMYHSCLSDELVQEPIENITARLKLVARVNNPELHKLWASQFVKQDCNPLSKAER